MTHKLTLTKIAKCLLLYADWLKVHKNPAPLQRIAEPKYSINYYVMRAQFILQRHISYRISLVIYENGSIDVATV